MGGVGVNIYSLYFSVYVCAETVGQICKKKKKKVDRRRSYICAFIYKRMSVYMAAYMCPFVSVYACE